MSKKRKAGSDDFKNRLSQAARNRAARERKSNNPQELAKRVAKAKASGYDLSGYSDKEISMALQGDGFDHNDYYRLTGKKPNEGGSGNKGGNGGGSGGSNGGGGGDRSVSITNPYKDSDSDDTIIGGPDPIVGDSPKDFLGQYISNSFNARGGTLTNTGDIKAGGDIKLDNTVTNSNRVNQVASDGYRLDLGDLAL